MLSLSSQALREKNKLHESGAWLILLEVQLPDNSSMRLVRNTEDIVWNDFTWIAFPFDLDDLKEDSKEFPELTINVDNSTRALQPYLEQYKGLVGCNIILRVIHSKNLDSTEAELEEYFTITNSSSNTLSVEFTLGGDFPVNVRVPNCKYMKNFCNHIFKSVTCGYNGSATSCDGTLTRCQELNNSPRFGGYPAIPMGGIYV